MKKYSGHHKNQTVQKGMGIVRNFCFFLWGFFLFAAFSVSMASEIVISEESEPVEVIDTEFIECYSLYEHEGNQGEINSGSLASKYQCSFYPRPEFIKLLYNELNPPQGGIQFDSLNRILEQSKADSSHRYIFLHGYNIFELFSSQDTAALSEAFEAGSPVGTSAQSEGALTTALGLGDLQKHVSGDSSGTGAVYFLHRRISLATLISPERRLVDHLEVRLDIDQPYSTILGRVIDWQEKNLEHNNDGRSVKTVSVDKPLATPRSASLDSSTGWTLCKTYSYSGTIPKESGGDAGGAYSIDLEFYYTLGDQLADNKDRWLVTADLTSSMSQYYNENGNKHKGWYMRSMNLYAELGQFLGDIEEWSPTTTVGSTSRTTSIGGSISGAVGQSTGVGAGVSWSASTTNSTNDVEIVVNGNTTNSDGINGNDWVDWQVDFAKCQANNLGTKLKQPAAAAQSLWKEPLAIITTNADLNEGTKVRLIPMFKIEHCRCGTGGCPIRKSSTYSPWGSTGKQFQVVVPESCQ